MLVSIAHGSNEAEMFKLLQSESCQGKDQDELCFGPFDQGKWVNFDL